MFYNKKELQLQYEGFIKTPFLWHGIGLFDLVQFEHNNQAAISYQDNIPEKLRLGKQVERFVSFELQHTEHIKLLAENIQIQQEKMTLGELDCLLLENNIPVHLEIIYKFYLYDPSITTSEINKWIGPNRRDSLTQKLTKLTEKQLPLLYSNECKIYLETIGFSSETMVQKVYFKAQLFVPLHSIQKEYPYLNNQCILGYYCTKNELSQFSNAKFYIPSKHNWLVLPHAHVSWLNYTSFLEKVSCYLQEENAPLCWVKKPNGEFLKLFVVWW
ncbi:DUF1853 family protein [Tenacibaculum sp. TC6]|uniref:DUF1853 family protein n=1 Tax=Tenacibaculum sp. TC6 TaxID=3423223 RepID=UPI003D35CA04